MRTKKGKDNKNNKSKKGFGAFIKSLFSKKDKGLLFDDFKAAFQDVKAEFDDHRETINYNTNEIQANYEYLAQLDSKMEKMNEKLEELMMFSQVQKRNNSPVYTNMIRGAEFEEPSFDDISLTSKEKEVFLAIYTSATNISYKEISKKTGMSQNLVACYVRNLVSKGVPLQKNYATDMEVGVDMDPLFKEIQAKKNVVGLNERISKFN